MNLVLSPNLLFSNGGFRQLAPPCDSDQNHPWSKAFTKKICANDITNPQCSEECCFTIVYQYRWLEDDLFELNTSGIFYEGSDDCEDSIDQVLVNCYTEILKDIADCPECDSYIPGFRIRMLNQPFDDWGDPITEYYAWVKASTTGKCKVSGLICDSEKRCCWYKTQVHFKNSTPFNVTGFHWYWQSESVDISCPIEPFGCQIDCWQIAKSPWKSVFGLTPCGNIPCNFGEWKYKNSTAIELPFCYGCRYSVFYRYRKTENCEPEDFTDIELLWVETSGNCHFCTTDFTALFNLGWQWLLMNAEFEYPVQGDPPKQTLRAMSKPCWENALRIIDVYQQPSYTFIPCSFEGCCWNRYSVHNIGNQEIGDKFNFNIIESGSENILCDDPDLQCYVICNHFPSNFTKPRINSNKITTDNSKIAITAFYNFVNKDVHFYTTKKANIDMRIKIFDMTGEKLIDKEQFVKDGQFVINIKEFPAGVYFYYISGLYEFYQFGKIFKY